MEGLALIGRFGGEGYSSFGVTGVDGIDGVDVGVLDSFFLTSLPSLFFRLFALSFLSFVLPLSSLFLFLLLSFFISVKEVFELVVLGVSAPYPSLSGDECFILFFPLSRPSSKF